MSSHLQTLLLIRFPLLLVPLFSSLLRVEADAPPNLARPGCEASCGNVSIPFPFGMGVNCFLDSWFQVECKEFGKSKGVKKPFLSKLDIEVMEISILSWGYDFGWSFQNLTVGLPFLNKYGADTKHSGLDLRGSPYNFSTDNNVFLMEGCAGGTILVDQTNTDYSVMAGCSTVCRNKTKTSGANFTNKCSGDGVECCQMQLHSEYHILYELGYYHRYGNTYSPLQFYEIGFYGQSSGEHPNSVAATLIKEDSVDQYVGKLSTLYPSTVPALLYWSWVSSHPPDPNPQAHCYHDETTNSTQCSCTGNSAGNPYVLNGCKDHCNHCDFNCIWDEGSSSYHCLDPKSPKNNSLQLKVISVILSIAIGPLLMVFGCRWLYLFIQRRRKTERRVKFFKLKLQQHQSSNEGFMERTKLFTLKELDKATDNFNENRIVGKGGQGTVYKGMLIDGKIAAIKKSKLIEESQMEQFINEVVILSQINHRNVVKLYGCCLETQVPLLVYEFISNGTLSQHIHDPSEDSVLDWPIRLKIATDSAGAIAYLHSSSSTPIYHRDIKPSNILLDEKYKAKVSDFGSSKSIEIDQTHLTTLVQGTFGYLDPEYFETSIFTEKSDVYSFGVVLLELLTSKKPIYRTETMEQKTLAVEFFLHVQNSSLFNILDPEIVKEAKEEELMAVADLAKCCLNESGRLRPTMKQVAMALETIIEPPAEVSAHDQQSFRNEGFSGIFMPGVSDVDFMSSPVPPGASSPMYIDVHPLLHDTI